MPTRAEIMKRFRLNVYQYNKVRRYAGHKIKHTNKYKQLDKKGRHAFQQNETVSILKKRKKTKSFTKCKDSKHKKR